MAKPYKIFLQKFREDNLRALFKEKVSQTRAIGRDGTHVSQFADRQLDELSLIARKVSDGTYKFTRYREKLISKGPFKAPRLLSIPTVRDRLTLRALCEFLAEVYPEAITQKPHAYVKSIQENLAKNDVDAAFLRVDVRDYYPSINIELLIKLIKKRVRKVEAISLIESALRTPTIKFSVGGVPQGLSISNILANIYLLEIDDCLRKSYTYYRYVDDILIICKSTTHAQEAFNEVKWRLKHQRHLQCHELGDGSKSCIANVIDGVDYLGFRLKKNRISVRDSSLKKMINSIISMFSKYRGKRNDQKLIWLLNLRITGCRFQGEKYGWMYFFLQSDDTSQLSRLDRFVARFMEKKGKSELLGRQKTFIKTYHELRYNGKMSKYIPNFDEIGINDMVDVLSQLSGKTKFEIGKMDDNSIRSQFFSLIKKEVAVLERDVLESFS
ncbi:reverse transcriptase domain-containing protein [Azospirillum sp. INR13]|uniref:reverse transcriptase domain-containing protein n=1 Tax=Azospirillum sp. INR13 TaxID=2596919 RepID=UPI001892682D|nr:reverse transcriptase domain-containing protein [Azospirillum sp. INR13]